MTVRINPKCNSKDGIHTNAARGLVQSEVMSTFVMWIGSAPRRIVTEQPDPACPLNDGERVPRSWVVALCLVALLIPICFAAVVSLFPENNLEKATAVAIEMILKTVLGFAVAAWAFTPRTKRGRFAGVLITLSGTLFAIGFATALALHP